MYLDKRLTKISSIFILISVMILFVLLSRILVTAVYAGKVKTTVAILLFPFVLAMPYVLSKTRVYTFIPLLLFVFWLSVPIILSGVSAVFHHLYLFEFGIWAFLLVQCANSLISKNVESTLSLKRFPYRPFLVYILGAFFTYFISYKTIYDITRIRIICIFPFLLCIAIFLTVRSTEDAERLLWIVLISASILGLLFLVGQKLFWFVKPTEYAKGSGRLTMSLPIPYLGTLRILPTDAAELFSFMLSFAYGLWLFHRSFLARTFAGIMCFMFGLIIITSQGRAGAIAALVSVLVITMLTILTDKSFHAKTLLGPGILITLMLAGLWYSGYTSQYEAFYQRSMILFSNPLTAPSLISRQIVWRRAMKVFFRNPFGVGLNGFELSPSGSTWYAHNLLLFLLLSFGIIGCSGFIWIILTFFRVLWRGLQSCHRNLQGLCISGIGGITTLFIVGIFSPMIWEPYSVVMVWAPLAIVLAASMLEQRK